MSICIRSHWRFLEEYHVKKALEETQELYEWLLKLLQVDKMESEEVNEQEEYEKGNHS